MRTRRERKLGQARSPARAREREKEAGEKRERASEKGKVIAMIARAFEDERFWSGTHLYTYFL